MKEDLRRYKKKKLTVAQEKMQKHRMNTDVNFPSSRQPSADASNDLGGGADLS